MISLDLFCYLNSHLTFIFIPSYFCQKCLISDKSCSQAWKILALIKEKDLEYTKAAECKQEAWKIEFQASAAVGFKLAFCLLKAINVYEGVLDQYPDYPRIRDKILKTAQ